MCITEFIHILTEKETEMYTLISSMEGRLT